MKQSTFSPEWDVLYSLVVVVERNENSFSLQCCCDSGFSAVKQVKLLHCSQRAGAVGALLAQSVSAVTNFGLQADVYRRVHADPGRHRGDDDFCVTHVRADPCRHTDVESINRS